ncbi:LOW QUALITY PROTEIN: S-adenosyl-L-methionine-dependent tRNA 4-demethylwyosine synthase TYW1-like [Acropora millepora]|uniref:LOW QUALITY PROTEIN: S-adenosyl-L-methionine-dependent tRNA 4-demethylwyosine synthase TYW1-like n=1 Tax=Acropora millepora TaxID=45264 RepID=UPI001CF1E649|nr:LOW QUALITY PROTEIN: S-adenosyl-L-methionine-dependent tRNA 4-demethylwyosine synthase TYW1-like [Acropora millepora]
MAALTLGILSLLFLFVIAFSLQVDASSQNSVKDSTWQDRLVDWWLSVRKFGASLVIGGMGLSWLIVKLQGKQTVNNKEVGEEKLGKDEAYVKESNIQKYSVMETAKFDGLKIFFGSQTGKAKSLAYSLQVEAEKMGLGSEVVDLKNYEPEDSLSEETKICAFIVSTYVDGNPPESAKWFYKWLDEASSDFRVQKSLLKDLNYAVFGLGDSLYEDNFNLVGRNVDKRLEILSARKLFPLGVGDENLANSKHGGTENDFKFWSTKFLSHAKRMMEKGYHPSTEKCSQELCCQNQRDAAEEKEIQADEVLYETTSEESSEEDNEQGKKNGLLDLEELGPLMKSTKKVKKEKEGVQVNDRKRVLGKKQITEPKEMITPLLEKALTKQGYRLIGTHSGVKLCRWTKSMLRGRGGCYKHTFYGIESHRCMETTPSLACANKCVFCWRHHTNPVGTEWKWKMDDPDTIVNGAMENHRNMIKQFRGVPGVKTERFEEGMKIRHCALSLVGEPIMYPRINELIKILHGHEISSFLVTNAQFPDAIRNLTPVTQLYVSVDASTKESLKKIDRPLFRDFWSRFLDSLKALSEKGQRTVYRLTLVKSWNNEELQNYADLVSIGKPDFIEVKGVTYCGESKASTLTMENVPWHEEVIGFVQQLVDLLPDYEIACEHEHSNCLLIAQKKFKKSDGWYTWIDYPTFHQLMRRYEESDGTEDFSALDYMAKTPDWALMGHAQRGFDPLETRWHRKKRKDISGC